MFESRERHHRLGLIGRSFPTESALRGVRRGFQVGGPLAYDSVVLTERSLFLL